jgi:hypothetical protein
MKAPLRRRTSVLVPGGPNRLLNQFFDVVEAWIWYLHTLGGRMVPTRVGGNTAELDPSCNRGAP